MKWCWCALGHSSWKIALQYCLQNILIEGGSKVWKSRKNVHWNTDLFNSAGFFFFKLPKNKWLSFYSEARTGFSAVTFVNPSHYNTWLHPTSTFSNLPLEKEKRKLVTLLHGPSNRRLMDEEEKWKCHLHFQHSPNDQSGRKLQGRRVWYSLCVCKPLLHTKFCRRSILP